MEWCPAKILMRFFLCQREYFNPNFKPLQYQTKYLGVPLFLSKKKKKKQGFSKYQKQARVKIEWMEM